MSDMSWDRRAPRWMWKDPSVDTAVKLMINVAERDLAQIDFRLKIMAELMKPSQGVASALKSPLAIRQVHPEARWG